MRNSRACLIIGLFITATSVAHAEMTMAESAQKYREALSLLAERSPTRGIPQQNAKEAFEERVSWLEIVAELDDANAKLELKRIAPARYRKLFGDSSVNYASK